MAIYEIQQDSLVRLKDTAFTDEGIRERDDLQRLLREQIDVISPDTMVIAEEFCDWEDSKRRIDLLGLDKDANLVVIELKRTDTGGHMELQAIRYASMVSVMTFEQVVKTYERHLQNLNREDRNAEQEILDFLGWDEANEDEFAEDVRIVLASAEFSKEVTSAVIWLNEHSLDIRCVRLRPCKLDNRTLLDVQQIIPLPEAAEYQIRIREKTEQKREARQSTRNLTRYDLTIGDTKRTQLSKRELAYWIAYEAINRQASPEQVCNVLSWRRNYVWAVADGEVNQEEFIQLARVYPDSSKRAFDEKRYFTVDDKLIHLDGMTYAFSNQWGEQTLKAVDLMIKEIGATDISYSPSIS
jgi:hypothetical protein